MTIKPQLHDIDGTTDNAGKLVVSRISCTSGVGNPTRSISLMPMSARSSVRMKSGSKVRNVHPQLMTASTQTRIGTLNLPATWLFIDETHAGKRFKKPNGVSV
jgi:hypothetical protein